MPRVSKAVKRAASTRPGDPSPPKELLDKYMCARCGRIFKRQRGNFSCSHSPLYRGNGGYLPFCNYCVDDLFGHYREALGDEKEAIRRVCSKTDIYWNPALYAMVVKSRSTNSRMRSYISKTNLIGYIDKTYDDTLDEEANEEAKKKAEEAEEEAKKKAEEAAKEKEEEETKTSLASNVLSDEETPRSVNQRILFEDIPEPTFETIDFWGAGYTPDVYYDLDRRYKKWTDGKDDELDETSAALYKQICLCEVNIAKNMMAGKPIEAAQKSMNELLGSLNAKPIQKMQEKTQDGAANSSFDNLPFGVGIKMCENMRPIPKPDPRFDDVDGIVRYISVWFIFIDPMYSDVHGNPFELLENPKAHPATAQRRTVANAMAAKVERNGWDGIRLNPKCYDNGQSAAKPRREEGSTTKWLQAKSCGGHL